MSAVPLLGAGVAKTYTASPGNDWVLSHPRPLCRLRGDRNSEEELTPRVEALEGRRRPLLLRLLEVLAQRWYQQPLIPMRVIAHNPRFLLPSLGLSVFVSGPSQLGPTLRALAIHLVAVRNGCEWCIDFGDHQAERGGLDVDRLTVVTEYASDPRFTPAERAALALVDAIVATNGHPDDATFAAAREHYDDRALVELVLAVAIENAYNWVNGSLGVEAQGFCAIIPIRAQTAAIPARAA